MPAGDGTDDGRENSHIFAKELAQQLIREAPRLYLYFRGAQKLRHEFIRKYSRRHLQFPRHVRREKKKLRKSLFFFLGPTVRPHISHGKKRKSSFFSRPVFMGISRCRSPSYITSPFKVGKLFQTYQDFPHKYTAHCQPKKSLNNRLFYLFFGSVLAVSFPPSPPPAISLISISFFPRTRKRKDICIIAASIYGKKQRVTGPRRTVPTFSISTEYDREPATEERRYPA